MTYRKLYAAYKAATEYKGAPTVILAKTVKGWTLGPGVEARNITHQAKKLSEAELKIFRDRLQLPIPDAKLKDAPYYHPGPKSEEVEYLHGAPPGARRAHPEAGGPARRRCRHRQRTSTPSSTAAARRRSSTTMVFTRILRNLIRAARSRVADRADHPGRGAHLRHGPAVQGGRDLLGARPALRAGRLRPACSPIARRPTARSSRRASPRPARWHRSRPPARPTRATATRRSRSTSSTRCSGSSGPATRCGPSGTRAGAGSSWAPRPGARR